MEEHPCVWTDGSREECPLRRPFGMLVPACTNLPLRRLSGMPFGERWKSMVMLGTPHQHTTPDHTTVASRSTLTRKSVHYFMSPFSGSLLFAVRALLEKFWALNTG